LLFNISSKLQLKAMDGLSVAASVIAVIQISSQILDLCRTYYINVKDARRNIERVRTEITSLQDVLTNVIDLTGDPNSSSLRTLNILNQEDGLIQQCQLELADLAAKLEPREDKSRMRQFGLRALKWPLTTQEVDKLLVTIGRHKASLTLALTTDQT
jgi:ankyrin repeat domain-containing protein 50